MRNRKESLISSLSGEKGFILAKLTNTIKIRKKEPPNGKTYAFERSEIEYDEGGEVIVYEEKGYKTRDRREKTVTSYSYNKYGRVIGTRKKERSSDTPALKTTEYEKYEYHALGRKDRTETTTEMSGVDVDAEEISNVELDGEGKIVSYDYTKDGKGYHVSDITYYENGPFKGKVASYNLSDGTETVTYSDVTYDENGNVTSFTKTLPDGSEEHHEITRDENGEITEYVIRDENGQVIAHYVV
ncbi:MAG: hypothetical protein HWN65_03915 [Candidatus Helarchaeota archaeon]|nr:hypothetical protein [Candidatus Helarchaeota archaeon]